MNAQSEKQSDSVLIQMILEILFIFARKSHRKSFYDVLIYVL